MSSESASNSPPPDDTAKSGPPSWRPKWYAYSQLGPVTTYTYLIDEQPADFTFNHTGPREPSSSPIATGPLSGSATTLPGTWWSRRSRNRRVATSGQIRPASVYLLVP